MPSSFSSARARAVGTIAAAPTLAADTLARARGRKALGADGKTPLMDAKPASQLLDVPPSWLLAQARARAVPHHRLGHYVRFDVEHLRRWLDETKIDVGGRHGR